MFMPYFPSSKRADRLGKRATDFIGQKPKKQQRPASSSSLAVETSIPSRCPERTLEVSLYFLYHCRSPLVKSESDYEMLGLRCLGLCFSPAGQDGHPGALAALFRRHLRGPRRTAL